MHRYLLDFGTDKVLVFINRYFYIKHADKYVRDVVASCHVCLATKYYTHAIVGKQYYEISRKPMKTVSMDLCGSLPQTPDSNKYILVLCNHFSKLTKLYPIKNQKVDTICKTLRELYLREVGTPEEILTDRSGQFGSDRWKAFDRGHGFEIRLAV